MSPRFLTVHEIVTLDDMVEAIQDGDQTRQARNRFVRDLAATGVPLRAIGRQLGVTHAAVRSMIDTANRQDDAA